MAKSCPFQWTPWELITLKLLTVVNEDLVFDPVSIVPPISNMMFVNVKDIFASQGRKSQFITQLLKYETLKIHI